MIPLFLSVSKAGSGVSVKQSTHSSEGGGDWGKPCDSDLKQSLIHNLLRQNQYIVHRESERKGGIYLKNQTLKALNTL